MKATFIKIGKRKTEIEDGGRAARFYGGGYHLGFSDSRFPIPDSRGRGVAAPGSPNSFLSFSPSASSAGGNRSGGRWPSMRNGEATKESPPASRTSSRARAVSL